MGDGTLASIVPAATVSGKITTHTITGGPLTTAFTPAPECTTPFIPDGNCAQPICSATLLPLVVLDADGDSTVKSCLPSFRAASGTATPIFQYVTGHACPFGMNTAAVESPAGQIICCPNDLICQSSAGQCVACVGTLTAGTFLRGTTTGSQELAYVTDSITLPPEDGFTIFVTATPITLFPRIPTSAATPPVNTPETPAPTSTPGQQNSDSIKIGTIIAGIIAAVLLISLIAFLAIRYRRRRDNEPSSWSSSDRTQGHGFNRRRGFWNRKPQLAARATTRVELEEMPVEDGGAGIRVSKPALEGTTGILGLSNPFAKKRSELEARDNGAPSQSKGPTGYGAFVSQPEFEGASSVRPDSDDTVELQGSVRHQGESEPTPAR